MIHLESLLLDGNSITSLPACIGSMPSLLVLSAVGNQLTSLPSTIGGLHSSLIWLDMHDNAIVGLPSSITQLNQLVIFDLSQNVLGVDFSTYVFSSWYQIDLLRFSNSGLLGSVAPTAFDHLSSITNLQLSTNQLTGALPNLVGCGNLTQVLLDHNQFTGSIPQSWEQLVSLVGIQLQNNALTSPYYIESPTPMSITASLPKIQTLDLSNNALILSPQDGGDIGSFISNILSLSLQSLYLNHNNLNGFWLNTGTLQQSTQLHTLQMAYNNLTNLPLLLWASPLTYMDFSNNALSGVLPTGDPNVVTTGNTPAVTYINLQNNPALTFPALPEWLAQGLPYFITIPSSVAGSYLCLSSFSSSSKSVTILVDPAFNSYGGCVCSGSSFGVPPACVPVPVFAIVAPFQVPACPIPNFWNIVSVNYPIDGNLLPVAMGGASSMAYQPTNTFPASFSPSWYQYPSDRVVTSTDWKIDARDVRLNTLTSQLLWNQPLANSSSFPAGSTLQPVRTITIRLHINPQRFYRLMDTILVSDGVSGKFVASVAGTTLNSITVITASAYTSTPAYQSTYATQLASLGGSSVLLEVVVPSNYAVLSFTVLNVTGPAFVATYSMDFNCTAYGSTAAGAAAASANPGVVNQLYSSDVGTLCLQPNANQYVASTAVLDPITNRPIFECPSLLDPTTQSLHSLADPASVNYAGCRCVSGKFGLPPNCFSVPANATILPYAPAYSLEVDAGKFRNLAQFATNQTDSSATPPPAAASSTVTPIPGFPMGFSDAWYGASRATLGVLPLLSLIYVASVYYLLMALRSMMHLWLLQQVSVVHLMWINLYVP